MVINQESIKALPDIHGKSTLITGASGALGETAALALAASGCKLTLATGQAL